MVGSWIASQVPNSTMGSFSVFMTFLLGVKFIVKPVMTTKNAMEAVDPQKRFVQSVICGGDDRLYLRVYRCRRRHDDAVDPDQCAGV